MSINKVLSEHSHMLIHLRFAYGYFRAMPAELRCYMETIWLKNLLLGLLWNNFADPTLELCYSKCVL